MRIRTEKISSKQNQGIKNLVQLQKSAERMKQKLFLVEGIKEIEKVILAGYTIEAVYFCPEILSTVEVFQLLPETYKGPVFEVTSEVFGKIAYREHSGGILLVARTKLHGFDELNLTGNPLILVMDGIEKPGNIGAMFRTADAAGISAIIISNPGTDLYNPNVIRASLGCIFTVPTVVSDASDAVDWLKKKGISIFTSHLHASKPYYQPDYTHASAIVVGAEDKGVSDIWTQEADSGIVIPMKGVADSMNVSTAAAVLIFEACRQRDYK
jgi:RNA methyltransferase, TrmH family